MDFKIKKIGKFTSGERYQSGHMKKTRTFSAKKSIIGLLIIIVLLLTGTIKALSNVDFTVFLSIAGSDLATDPNGHTNFLLLGVGGGVHDGSDLTDTIIVASLDQKTNYVTLISIPRDLWLEDKTMGGSRINEVYFTAKEYYKGDSEKAITYMKDKIEGFLGTTIQYYGKIDFEGFKEIIDSIGGIDINVPEAIYDPLYPKGETGLYETFQIEKGQQHMDGETALKYARSRHTTSDFDRSNRQQEIIYAIKEKMLSSNTVFSKDKITKILDVIKKNIETNITADEIFTLGTYANKISKDMIVQRLIHDDPSKCGGLLYTPEKQFYGGAFVLISAGGVKNIQEYMDLNFDHPEIARENSKIHILNGSKREGAAGETKQILQRFCFDINRYGNAATKDIQQTTYYYKKMLDSNGNEINKRPVALEFLELLIPGKESTVIPEEYKDYMAGTDILLVLGADYTESSKYIEDPFYSLPLPAEAPANIGLPGAGTAETGTTTVPTPGTKPATAPTTSTTNENQ